ncbi:MAG: hypothetical protein K2P58_04200 [Hyphomonadaceae bacterium]|nr:hypothetical protein [Hyphomonadaceae bacterium]
MKHIVVAVALLAVACSAPPAATAPPTLDDMPSWSDARAAGVDFRAVGQEPGWLLDIHQSERIVLVWDYGENGASFPLTEPTYPQEGATHYETQAGGRTLQITIRRMPCEDAMSGEAFPAQVEAVIDGRTLSGCGRSV